MRISSIEIENLDTKITQTYNRIGKVEYSHRVPYYNLLNNEGLVIARAPVPKHYNEYASKITLITSGRRYTYNK